MKKTVLYVEECENSLVDALIRRKDVDLILLRFANCLHFSEEHRKRTSGIPVFIIDKSLDMDSEAERLRRFLSELGARVDFFYNDSEFNQEYIQKIARLLGLPGALSERQARIVRDKAQMKEFIGSIGYRHLDYRQLYSLGDAKAFAQLHGYPIIVKWKSGVSSIEVYRVENEAQLCRLGLDYSTGKYIAEQYCPYKIWCIDSIVSAGAVRYVLYTWLPFTNLDFATDKKKFAQIAFGQKPACLSFDPEKLACDIVRELGVSSGYLHLEAFVTDDGQPILCEFAWRTPGEHMLSNYSLLYGVDIPDRLIDALLQLPAAPLESSDLCVADVFLPMSEGTISEISDIAQMKERCDILDGEVLYKKGDVLVSKHKYTDSTGWAQVRCGMDDILAKIDSVYDAFTLKVVCD